MEDLVYAMPWRRETPGNLTPLLEREWLVTNGLGGYASGTLAGVATRRYHGLLIAAHKAPLGRVMMFNHLSEQIRLPDWSTVHVGGDERVGGNLDLHGGDNLVEFRLEGGLPVWRYELLGHVVEKRVFMPHRQNTVYINYRLLSGPGPVRLKLRPSVHFRSHDEPVSIARKETYTLTAVEDRYELSIGPKFPVLRLHLEGDNAAFTLCGQNRPDILYRIEESRGYDATGSLWSPGQFRVNLRFDHDVVLVASTENWETVRALKPTAALAA